MANDIDIKATPMIKQYLDIKKKHSDDILFFRMGDFYEMFFEDARTASAILDITLTSRQNDIPMCGIPYHAAESYIARLIKAGKRVAICEQMESVPSSGSIVRREVIRVITPGTIIEQNLIQGDRNNFLASIITTTERIGLAFADISTGDFFLSVIDRSIDLFRGEIVKYDPSEAVVKKFADNDDSVFMDFLKNSDIPVYSISEWLYDPDYMRDLITSTYAISGVKGLGITDDLEAVTAGSLMQYIKETHPGTLSNLKFPLKTNLTGRMVLDDATIRNLEIVRNQSGDSRTHTLFSILDRTKTAMGKRLLERNILQPLIDADKIEKRLDRVQFLIEYTDLRSSLGSSLSCINDIERIISRINSLKAFPRHFISLRNSLNACSTIKKNLIEHSGTVLEDIVSAMPDMAGLIERIHAAVEDEPAVSPEQGRVIKHGYNADLDRLYELKHDSKTWILEYQEEEKLKLGLSTLKVRYNRILGYYIEISRNQSVKIPETYLRKQTLVGAERFTTEKLQSFETDILSASEKIIAIENSEIDKLTADILQRREDLRKMADTIARIDFYHSLAISAVENNFIRPLITDNGRLFITDGRHPVVEKYFTREVFVPNDIKLDNRENMITLLTGPNMSGKSTYIRMCAIILLMAQSGSFVPAKHAEVSIADRIFTRIGASDNISRGESTFLVEMNETALILNNATEKSLIIMDEIGRGTSTYDGLSIAWAVVEYILRYIKARTLFATHYHELTSLDTKTGIENYNVSVKEEISGIRFLHKVVKGAADRSYGIHVAQLAGLPSAVISRSESILDRLEKSSLKSRKVNDDAPHERDEQLMIFNASNHIILKTIKSMDIDSMTPMEALNRLHELKKLV
jgi:DNA mismatch repair protein MutS